MNSSIARAHQVLKSLSDCGLENVIICPGSRNAPFIYASEKVSKVNFHSKIDERSAAFIALGIAKETNKPAAIITTSGSAISHAYPALLESEKSNIPLIFISADRPSFLRNSGFNQTIDQTHIFNNHTQLFLDIHENYPLDAIAQEVSRCYIKSTTIPRGPVHINISFIEPLAPFSKSEKYQLATTPNCSIDNRKEIIGPFSEGVKSPKGTIVISANGAGIFAKKYAEYFQLPIIADVTTVARKSYNSINYQSEMITYFKEKIKHVIVFGKPTLFRSITELLERKEVLYSIAIDEAMNWQNITLNAMNIIHYSQLPTFCKDKSWIYEWKEKDTFEINFQNLNHFSAAYSVWKSKNCARLLIGASNPIRQITSISNREMPADKVFSNRGTSGIDGTIATGIGIALSSNLPTRIYCGDITALHDASSLISEINEKNLDIHLVILNDYGGSIFDLLGYGKETYSNPNTKKFFTTKQLINFKSLALAYGWQYSSIKTLKELQTNLCSYSGNKVLSEIQLKKSNIKKEQKQFSNTIFTHIENRRSFKSGIHG